MVSREDIAIIDAEWNLIFANRMGVLLERPLAAHLKLFLKHHNMPWYEFQKRCLEEEARGWSGNIGLAFLSRCCAPSPSQSTALAAQFSHIMHNQVCSCALHEELREAGAL